MASRRNRPAHKDNRKASTPAAMTGCEPSQGYKDQAIRTSSNSPPGCEPSQGYKDPKVKTQVSPVKGKARRQILAAIRR
ncbi:hypothetical protein Ssi02_55000 [Sinosporangium siamense]|uniref:Uncharacterized protein n=1 Tax=Sinosporangium siamense TaxID=1367973 RepID=A0A919VEM4_9ACTN|nr:hypothetical protein Ssi02_55000 [Sinosporangium siamense]